MSVITKPDLDGTGLSHPARYSDGMTDRFAEILAELGYTPNDGPAVQVLDPFAGTGRIHELQQHGYSTLGVELEPEWAGLHPDTIVGDALAFPHADASFDAIVTSPTYGNRFADHYNASDPENRRSYKFDLGRDLTPGNSGQLHWGPDYRDFHQIAWHEAYRVLKPGGALVLNIKDHIRNHQRHEVAAWHLEELLRIGFTLRWTEQFGTSGLRAGANSRARIDGEQIYVMERPA